MDQEAREATANLIRGHEGTRYTVYSDSNGILHIGVGFNLDRADAAPSIEAVGADYTAICAGSAKLTEDQVETPFTQDLTGAIANAEAIVTNFKEHPEEVQSAIVDMIYNLGPGGFQKFEKAIVCFNVKDYCGAAVEMAHSLWAQQVPTRAADDIALVNEHCKS